MNEAATARIDGFANVIAAIRQSFSKPILDEARDHADVSLLSAQNSCATSMVTRVRTLLHQPFAVGTQC
jgi:hypothetical protein